MVAMNMSVNHDDGKQRSELSNFYSINFRMYSLIGLLKLILNNDK